MPETPHHLEQTISAITSCIKALNARIEGLSQPQRDSLCAKALEMDAESRYTLLLTHGLVEILPDDLNSVPFA